MHVDADIVIVGGGPAGLSTWLHLRELAPELAARTILLERDTYPREKLCGGGVTPLADALLRGLGIETACPSVPIDTIEFRFGERRHYFRRRNAFRVVRRHEFDHELATVAVSRGLQLHQDEAFDSLERAPGGLSVRTNRREYQVRVLVGADGVYSAVRQGMGLDDASRIARLIEILTPADAQADPEFAAQTAVFDFSAVVDGLQGYLWHFPCLEKGAAAMNRGICDTRIYPDRPRADLKALFGRELLARGVRFDASSWAGHPVRWFSEEGIFAQPNIVLAGDAAGIDPALGEGICQSLDYGDLVANALIDAFDRDAFRFDDYKERLLSHPLGQSLRLRTGLAKDMYAGGATPLDKLQAMLVRWLPHT
jgi:flavin-dependent dehydrogenase